MTFLSLISAASTTEITSLFHIFYHSSLPFTHSLSLSLSLSIYIYIYIYIYIFREKPQITGKARNHRMHLCITVKKDVFFFFFCHSKIRRRRSCFGSFLVFFGFFICMHLCIYACVHITNYPYVGFFYSFFWFVLIVMFDLHICTCAYYKLPVYTSACGGSSVFLLFEVFL